LWSADPFLTGGRPMSCEFRETGEQIGVVVHPGMVGWPRNNTAVIEHHIHALYGHIGVSHRRTLYNLYNMYILSRVGGVETQSYSSYRGSNHRAQAVQCKKCHLGHAYRAVDFHGATPIWHWVTAMLFLGQRVG
jgi:hypothetical protein